MTRSNGGASAPVSTPLLVALAAAAALAAVVYVRPLFGSETPAVGDVGVDWSVPSAVPETDPDAFVLPDDPRNPFRTADGVPGPSADPTVADDDGEPTVVAE